MNADMDALIRAEHDARDVFADANIALYTANFALKTQWSKEAQVNFDSARAAYREALMAFNVASSRLRSARL